MFKNKKNYIVVPERSKILLNAKTHRNTSESQRVSRLFLCPLKKGTKLPPNFYRGVVSCCCCTLFFWEFVLRRLYVNLKLKSILYGI